MTGIKRAQEISQHAEEHGDAETMREYRINVGSLARYKAMVRGKAWQPSRALKSIAEKYSDTELRALARGRELAPPNIKIPPINFSGERLRFGFLTDTHFGSLYSPPGLFEAAVAQFRAEDCAFAVHAGDVTEGMSSRPGHVYELAQIGFTAQRDYAIEMMRKWDRPWYCIDGNHDRWYIKACDARVVEEICAAVDGAQFLGHDVGELPLKGGCKIMLWHGEDGSSYATSYRLQKIIESLSGGTKPNVLLAGHTHKQAYFFERNIHALSGGSIQLQTPWMRGKRYPAHPGFWIIDLWLNGSSVARISPTWYPFYA